MPLKDLPEGTGIIKEVKTGKKAGTFTAIVMIEGSSEEAFFFQDDWNNLNPPMEAQRVVFRIGPVPPPKPGWKSRAHALAVHLLPKRNMIDALLESQRHPDARHRFILGA